MQASPKADSQFYSPEIFLDFASDLEWSLTTYAIVVCIVL